jgi:hypothetical protein
VDGPGELRRRLAAAAATLDAAAAIARRLPTPLEDAELPPAPSTPCGDGGVPATPRRESRDPAAGDGGDGAGGDPSSGSAGVLRGRGVTALASYSGLSCANTPGGALAIMTATCRTRWACLNVRGNYKLLSQVAYLGRSSTTTLHQTVAPLQHVSVTTGYPLRVVRCRGAARSASAASRSALSGGWCGLVSVRSRHRGAAPAVESPKDAILVLLRVGRRVCESQACGGVRGVTSSVHLGHHHPPAAAQGPRRRVVISQRS